MMSEKNKGKLQEAENVVAQDRIKRKVIIVMGILLIVAIITTIAVSGGSDEKLQEQLDLGVKYLNELDYDQALAAFNTALSIEPRNVNAHLGIVEVFLRTNEYVSALESAKKGYEVTGDERLKEKIDMIQGIIAANELQKQMQEHLNQGIQYLEAMEYERALSELKKAFLIDSQNEEVRLCIVEAYLGIAEDYIKANEFELSLQYAKEGYATTGDERLKEKEDVIEGIIAANEQQKRLQEQLNLGNQNLKEMYYAQALDAYNAALSIDAQNVEAYLGITEVYIRTNQYQTALEHAKKGHEVTGDASLQEKIDMLGSSRIIDSNGWIMKTIDFVSQNSAGEISFYYLEYTRERVGDAMLEKVYGYYNNRDNLDFRHEIIFDLERRQAKSIAKYNAQGEQEQYLELAYDGQGRSLISYGFFTPTGQLHKTAYAYNDSGYRVTNYNGISDNVSDFSDVETDSKGKVIKKTNYNKDGSLNYTTVYLYDGEENYLGYRNYNADGSLRNEYIKK